jgi:hypothetical protein
MKAFLLAFALLAFPAFAQNPPSASNPPNPLGAPGCGEPNAKFDVKTEKTQRPVVQPQTGKALVFFLEDDAAFGSSPKPTTRAGIDGKWVGATHGNSYFFVPVDPGEHHLCASWQSAAIIGQGKKTAAAHFTAEDGGVYYWRVRNTWSHDVGVADITLRELDTDEGALLASHFAFSTFHEKK